MSPPLVFLHIPKTAGTTLRAVFEGRYKASQRYIIGQDINKDIEQFVRMPESERFNIQLLMGHMSFGLHEYMRPGTRYFGLMREPVSRVWSEFQFLKTNQLHPFHQRVKSMSLDEYMASGFTGQSANGQTRLLSGNHEPGRPGIAGTDKLDAGDLDKAKANIDRHFLVAGTQSTLEYSLLILADKLGWKLPPCYLRRNVSQDRRVQPDAVERSLIQQHNSLDMDLYEWLSERVQKQIEAEGPKLESRVGRFRSMNSIYQKSVLAGMQYRNRLKHLFGSKWQS